MRYKLPPTWKKRAFMDVAEVSTGSTPPTGESENYGEYLPFVTPSELNSDKPIKDAATFLSELGSKKARTVPTNSILICCIGSLGKVGISGRKVAFNQQINALVFNEALVCPQYGYYYCRTLKPLLKHMAPSTTVPIINKGRFQCLEIPLPPLDEQRRIAAILDKADAVRRKRKEAIALTEDLLRSAFLEMFGDPVANPKGWNTTTLGEVLTDIESGWSPKCDPRKANQDEWGVLKLGAVTYGDYNEAEHKTLLPGDVPRPQIEVKQGDLLFSRKNTYELVGASAYVYQTRPGLMLPDLIFRLCCKADADSIYIWQALSQKTVRSQLTGLASGSSGSMPNISKSKLKTLTLPIPPLPLQQKYRSVAHSLWINQQRQEKNCELTEDLFNSLLQRAFRGDL